MTKTELRILYSEKRMLLSIADKNRMDDLMLIQFQQLDIEIPSLIMTYAPLESRNEFNTQLVTDYCYFKNPGQLLFYPVVDPGGETMHAVAVNDETVFEKNKYGIDEPVEGMELFPEEIDMVLVPLLAFDKRGYRVGYGKGHYDKFLKECRDDVVKVGFSYFDPADKITDANRYDVRLDYCVTPGDIYRF
jgi:5-formyltetrahydrofolate cyclo-ligase